MTKRKKFIKKLRSKRVKDRRDFKKKLLYMFKEVKNGNYVNDE